MVYTSVMHISGAITKKFICKINQRITNNHINIGEDFFLPAKVMEGYRFYQAVWQRLPKFVPPHTSLSVTAFSKKLQVSFGQPFVGLFDSNIDTFFQNLRSRGFSSSIMQIS